MRLMRPEGTDKEKVLRVLKELKGFQGHPRVLDDAFNEIKEKGFTHHGAHFLPKKLPKGYRYRRTAIASPPSELGMLKAQVAHHGLS